MLELNIEGEDRSSSGQKVTMGNKQKHLQRPKGQIRADKGNGTNHTPQKVNDTNTISQKDNAAKYTNPSNINDAQTPSNKRTYGNDENLHH